MSAGLRLKGQEVSIRIVAGGVLQASIDSVSSMDDNVKLNLLEQGFLGETANRFDESFDGFGANFEIQMTKADASQLDDAIVAKAKRETPDVVFNMVRTDLYSDGSSNVYTYMDMHWGSIPTTISSRGDYVKKKFSAACTERLRQMNGVV